MTRKQVLEILDNKSGFVKYYLDSGVEYVHFSSKTGKASVVFYIAYECDFVYLLVIDSKKERIIVSNMIYFENIKYFTIEDDGLFELKDDEIKINFNYDTMIYAEK